MSSALAMSDGEIRQLDAKAGDPVLITADDVKDPEKLARLLQRALQENAELRREWRPRRLYFRDVAVDGSGTVKHRLVHNFNGKVNFVAVYVDDAGYADLRAHSDTDENTLVLTSNQATTVTVLVWEAG